jgi:hypothetical protein
VEELEVLRGGSSARRKAPRVQRSAPPFAGGRVRRPSYEHAVSAVRRQARPRRSESVCRRRHHRPTTSRASDMRCSGRSGWGKASKRERSPSKESCACAPLTRECSVGHASRAAETRASMQRHLHIKRAPNVSDHARGGQGSNSSAVVLASRFDCRSWRAVRGHSARRT